MSGMSYARSLLEKYGWAEGKGLGKTETGIVEALKPKLKFDNTGIGHDHAEQFTNNWWEVAFNEAAKRVSVDVAAEKSNAMLESPDISLSTKRASVTKLMKENPLKYGKFIKTETLTSGGKLIPLKRKLSPPVESEYSTNSLSNLTDEELLKICGGRTAHKAARHGNKLVGKLARVIEQEKQLLTSLASQKNKERDGAKGDDGEPQRKKKRKVRSSDVGENDQQCELSGCAAGCDHAKTSALKGVRDDCDEECKVKKKRKRAHYEEITDTSSDHVKEIDSAKKRSSQCGGSGVNENNLDCAIDIIDGIACDGKSSKRKRKKRSR